jgi:hypothetical protein
MLLTGNILSQITGQKQSILEKRTNRHPFLKNCHKNIPCFKNNIPQFVDSIRSLRINSCHNRKPFLQIINFFSASLKRFLADHVFSIGDPFLQQSGLPDFSSCNKRKREKMYQNCHKIPSGHTYNMPNGLKYTKWQ